MSGTMQLTVGENMQLTVGWGGGVEETGKLLAFLEVGRFLFLLVECETPKQLRRRKADDHLHEAL